MPTFQKGEIEKHTAKVIRDIVTIDPDLEQANASNHKLTCYICGHRYKTGERFARVTWMNYTSVTRSAICKECVKPIVNAHEERMKAEIQKVKALKLKLIYDGR